MCKKFLNLVSIFLIFALSSGCDDSNKDKETDVLELNQLSFSFTEEESRGTLNIICNAAWTISSSADWLTVTPASSSGNYNGIVLKATANNHPDVRTGVLTVACGNMTEAVTVTQGGLEPYIIIDPVLAEVQFKGEEVTVSVTSSYPWTVQIPADADWITLKSGTSSQAILTVAENELYEERSATISFKLNDIAVKADLQIDQEAKPSTPPEFDEIPEEGEIEDDITLNGEYLNQIDEVWFGDVKGVIIEQTETSITITIPATATEGKVPIKVIYDGIELIAGEITLMEKVIEPVAARTVTIGSIGKTITITGTDLQVVTKVLFGSLEGEIAADRTNVSMKVTIPATATPADNVDLKLVYGSKATEKVTGKISVKFQCDNTLFKRWNDDPDIGYTEWNNTMSIENLWDDNLTNLFNSRAALPVRGDIITFDMGAEYKLERFRWWYRTGTASVAIVVGGPNVATPWMYRGDHPQKFRVYGSATPDARKANDEAAAPENKWILLGEFEAKKPSGLEYGVYNDEDSWVAWTDGEEFLIDVSKREVPVRYIRIDSLIGWGLVAGPATAENKNFHAAEIRFWGLPLN